MDMADILRANADQMSQFVSHLFCHADDDSFVSLRTFDQFERGKPAVGIEGIRLGDTRRLLERACRAAEVAANGTHPAVFAPPVATFNNPDKARHADLANGVALSVEIDAGDTARARAKLEHILGPVTMAMASGSFWTDPATGEMHDKLHLHWRLSEPTRTPAEHDKLREARWCAAILVGGDTTAAPPCHPLRWPGSWNTKGKPRLARITAGNMAAEVHLLDVLEKLQGAVEAAGLESTPAADKVPGEPQAPLSLIDSAMQAVPNADLSWDDWNRVGMAAWNATGGSADGLKTWADWSAKSSKHEEQGCADRWNHYATSPPTRIGAGTIFHMAGQNGWARPRAEPEDAPEMGEDDWASLLSHYDAETVPPVPPKAEGEREHIWEAASEWNEAEIPKRDWIAKGYFIRRSVTIIAGSGSAGKSSLTIGYAVALALGRVWSRFRPIKPCRVMIYNTEDDDDEQRRRFSATLRQFKASPSDLANRVYRVGPRAIGTLIERDPSTGRMTLTGVMADLARRIEEIKPDVLLLDPFIELHNADENDNTAQRGIIAFLRTQAALYDMAVGLIHHARKGSSAAAGDPDMIRGAGAIVAACRVAITVAVMTEEEATHLNVPPADRHDYFRVDSAKSNYARIESAEWFRRAVYDLTNGDSVAAPVPFEPKKAVVQVGNADLNTALDRIEQGFEPGVRYAASKRGATNHRWVGYVLTEMCGMDEAQAGKLIFDWLKNRLLVEKSYRDPTDRKQKQGVYVDNTRRPD